MYGGDGWRVIACAAGSQDKTIINRIMLRFRPIAPKPATDGSSSGCWKPENKNGAVTSVRMKRKYVRVKKNNEYYKRRRKRKSSSSDLEKSGREDDRNGKLFTLQLLPETTDLTQDSSPAPKGSSSTSVRKDHVQEKTDPPRFFHLSKQVAGGSDLCRVAVPDRKTAAMVTEKRIIETWVTVESVTDTCMDLVGELGSTDAEKMKNLEKDTCPGFISDGSNRVVQWVNEAYRKMVTVSEENNGRSRSRSQSPSPSTLPLVQITARLVIKDKLLPYLHYPAFTCWVRLQYTWQKEKYSQMVPCDVWKMDCGGFAWRLDVKAALSLAL